MIHAVELPHDGDHDSAVLYIAATPSTPENVRYMKQQVADFKARVPPEDFRSQGSDETKFKGYLGEEGILGGGRKAAGFVLWEHEGETGRFSLVPFCTFSVILCHFPS